MPVFKIVKDQRVFKGTGGYFNPARFCEPASFDVPPLRAALEREGIPWISLEFEDKPSVFDAIRAQAETFVEASLFFA